MRLALITSNVIFLLLAACISSRKNSYPGLSNSSPSFITTNAEALMFTSGPEIVDENKLLNEKQREGLLSGVVFTEIDHNYVNPVTRPYRNEVEEIFGNRELWCTKGGDADNYASGESVFNEYMTHGLFCIYVLDSYDQETARFVINQRETLMTDRRHSLNFLNSMQN